MPAPFPAILSRCPVCKKADPCSGASPHCPRCGCDLTKVAAAYAAARQHTIAAAASLRECDPAAALEHAAYAWSLSNLPSIPPLACLAAIHSRKLNDLALWRSRLAED